jgi:hypothetical protein
MQDLLGAGEEMETTADLAWDMAAKEHRRRSFIRLKSRQGMNIDVEQLLMAMEEAFPQRSKR